MTAAGTNLTIERGASWSTSLIVTDPTGAHINHTGYTIRMEVRDATQGTLLAAFATDSTGGITINGSGDILIAITAATSKAFLFDRGVYDLKVTTVAGAVSYYLRGDFLIKPTVTA